MEKIEVASNNIFAYLKPRLEQKDGKKSYEMFLRHF